jgi:hypothetical protein
VIETIASPPASIQPCQDFIVEGHSLKVRRHRKLRNGHLVLISAMCDPGLHHLAPKATDIYGALAVPARADYALIGPVSRPGSRHSQIAFMHPKGLNGVLMHLVEHEQR